MPEEDFPAEFPPAEDMVEVEDDVGEVSDADEVPETDSPSSSSDSHAEEEEWEDEMEPVIGYQAHLSDNERWVLQLVEKIEMMPEEIQEDFKRFIDAMLDAVLDGTWTPPPRGSYPDHAPPPLPDFLLQHASVAVRQCLPHSTFSQV